MNQPTEEGLKAMKKEIEDLQRGVEQLKTKLELQTQAKETCGICEQARGQSKEVPTGIAGAEEPQMKCEEQKGSLEEQAAAKDVISINSQEAQKQPQKRQRIICIPCGLKENAMKTVEWAHSKLLGSNDHVVLVCVREHTKQTLDQNVPKDVVDVSEVHSQKEDEKIVEILNKFKDLLPGRDVELKILRGDKRKELVEYINILDPNFVLVGAREMSGFKRAFTTSTPDHLAQNLRVPVMVYRHSSHHAPERSSQEVPAMSETQEKHSECQCNICKCSPCQCSQRQEQEKGGNEIQAGTTAVKCKEIETGSKSNLYEGQRIVCIPCDLGEHSMKTVEWASSKLVTAEDHVVLVCVREHTKQTLDQNVPKDVVDVSEVHSQKEDEKIVEILNKFKDLLPGRDVELKILRGDKRKELVEYINILDPNFVLVGAREMSGIKKTFTNSTSEYLAQQLRVPVMIYKQKPK